MDSLRYAQIYYKDDLAGVLCEAPEGGSYFEYDPGFKGDIACALPRAQNRHDWARGLHPFFSHLGPEGWLRSRQARISELDTQDDFGFLLNFGHDCIGAVSVRAPGDVPAFDTAALDTQTRAAVSARKTVSGIQPKLFVHQQGADFIPAEGEGPAEWIAKFPADNLSHMVLNEDLSLQATAILLGAENVTQFRRAVVAGIEQPALIVKRFDRTDDGQKLRLEDFAQVLSVPRGAGFSGKYESSFEALAEGIRQHSAFPEIDLYHFFHRIVAFVVLGNCDCHLKNWSLLETPRGLRLSPVYDVLNTYLYAAQGYSTVFGLAFNGVRHHWDSIDRAVLENLARVLGIAPTAAQRVLADVLKKEKRVLSLVTPSESSSRSEFYDFRRNYAETIRTAFERLKS